MDYLRNYLDELRGALTSLDLRSVESCRRQKHPATMSDFQFPTYGSVGIRPPVNCRRQG